jgi:hypothetical protein
MDVSPESLWYGSRAPFNQKATIPQAYGFEVTTKGSVNSIAISFRTRVSLRRKGLRIPNPVGPDGCVFPAQRNDIVCVCAPYRSRSVFATAGKPVYEAKPIATPSRPKYEKKKPVKVCSRRSDAFHLYESRTYHARPDVEPLRAGRPGRAQVPDPKSRVSPQPRGTTGTPRPGE